MSYQDLAGLLTFRPLSKPLGEPTYGGSTTSPFSAPFRSTVRLLAAEIRHLKPREAFLEADFDETQLRLDGMPRATAKARSEGVILTLVGTDHGDLRYPCSTFWTWQDNLRAIALALEALRKVDRYGVTTSGEQYAGWKQLPAGDGSPDAGRGRHLINMHGSVAAALKATHPDHGGDPRDFADVQAARQADG